MICYKDRSYCYWSAAGICKNTVCDKAFTQHDHVDAMKWWIAMGNANPGNYPVMLADLQTKDCGSVR